MIFSIKNIKFSVYELCQNSSFVLFVTKFSYHMYRKNAVLNGKQKQMKPLIVQFPNSTRQINLQFSAVFPLKSSKNANLQTKNQHFFNSFQTISKLFSNEFLFFLTCYSQVPIKRVGPNKRVGWIFIKYFCLSLYLFLSSCFFGAK